MLLANARPSRLAVDSTEAGRLARRNRGES